MIILDPAFTTDSTIADASRYAATDLSSPVAAQFAVLRNSVISLGAPIGTAYNAFNDLAQKNGLDWSATGVSAAAYIDAPVTFDGTSGGIVINRSIDVECRSIRNCQPGQRCRQRHADRQPAECGRQAGLLHFR